MSLAFSKFETKLIVDRRVNESRHGTCAVVNTILQLLLLNFTPRSGAPSTLEPSVEIERLFGANRKNHRQTYPRDFSVRVFREEASSSLLDASGSVEDDRDRPSDVRLGGLCLDRAARSRFAFFAYHSSPLLSFDKRACDIA